MSDEMKKLNILCFDNGNVACCDMNGKQVPQYQRGNWPEVRDLLIKDGYVVSQLEEGEYRAVLQTPMTAKPQITVGLLTKLLKELDEDHSYAIRNGEDSSYLVAKIQIYKQLISFLNGDAKEDEL